MKFTIDFAGIFNFINSQLFSGLFSGLSTVFTGLIALRVFNKQKRDEKEKAARILIGDIRKAERAIDDLLTRIKEYRYDDLPNILPINNWKSYSYLFAFDFDEDELEKMNAFFTKCEFAQNYVEKNNNFFWITAEERAKVVQNKLFDLIFEAKGTSQSVDQNKLSALKKNILDVYVGDGYSYAPVKTVNSIQNYLQNIEKITTTTAGVKLKRFANK